MAKFASPPSGTCRWRGLPPIECQPLGELVRVLKLGGTLVVGTPDHATRSWRIIEPFYGALTPGGYKDEHITHYTQASLSIFA